MNKKDILYAFFLFFLLLFSCNETDENEKKESSKKMASELCNCLNNDSTYTFCIMTLQESNPKYEELTQEQLLEEVKNNCPKRLNSITNTYVEGQ